MAINPNIAQHLRHAVGQSAAQASNPLPTEPPPGEVEDRVEDGVDPDTLKKLRAAAALMVSQASQSPGPTLPPKRTKTT